eukprot:superscaffoldBa00004130_g18333
MLHFYTDSFTKRFDEKEPRMRQTVDAVLKIAAEVKRIQKESEPGAIALNFMVAALVGVTLFYKGLTPAAAVTVALAVLLLRFIKQLKHRVRGNPKELRELMEESRTNVDLLKKDLEKIKTLCEEMPRESVGAETGNVIRLEMCVLEVFLTAEELSRVSHNDQRVTDAADQCQKVFTGLEKMFAAKAKAAVKCLGAEGDLIYNKNANQKIDMLTLVKVKVKKRIFWSTVEYKISDQTLLDLLQEPDFSIECKEEVLMKDFENLNDSSIGGHAAAGLDAPKVDVKVSAAVDTVDGVSPFTLWKKTVDTKKLKESCADKKIKEKMVDTLKLKETEKLTFVHQTVYNTAPVTFYGKTGKNGLVSAVFQKFGCSLWRKKKEETSFTIPKDVTIAYSLMEITTEDNTL